MTRWFVAILSVLAVLAPAPSTMGTAFAQVPPALRPYFEELAAGGRVRLFNRALTTVKEGGRTVVRLDARPGDGGADL